MLYIDNRTINRETEHHWVWMSNGDSGANHIRISGYFVAAVDFLRKGFRYIT